MLFEKPLKQVLARHSPECLAPAKIRDRLHLRVKGRDRARELLRRKLTLQDALGLPKPYRSRRHAPERDSDLTDPVLLAGHAKRRIDRRDIEILPLRDLVK